MLDERADQQLLLRPSLVHGISLEISRNLCLPPITILQQLLLVIQELLQAQHTSLSHKLCMKGMQLLPRNEAGTDLIRPQEAAKSLQGSWSEGLELSQAELMSSKCDFANA